MACQPAHASPHAVQLPLFEWMLLAWFLSLVCSLSHAARLLPVCLLPLAARPSLVCLLPLASRPSLVCVLPQAWFLPGLGWSPSPGHPASKPVQSSRPFSSLVCLPSLPLVRPWQTRAQDCKSKQKIFS